MLFNWRSCCRCGLSGRKSASTKVRKAAIVLVAISTATLLWFSLQFASKVPRPKQQAPKRLKASVECSPSPSVFTSHENHGFKEVYQRKVLRSEAKALVVVETQHTPRGKRVVELLAASRFPVKLELAGKHLPSLTYENKGKYAVIIFERLDSYIYMEDWSRQLLDKYCKNYGVGIVIFCANDGNPVTDAALKGFPILTLSSRKIRNYRLNPSPVLRITKAGSELRKVAGSDWTLFRANFSYYEPLAFAEVNNEAEESKAGENGRSKSSDRLVTVLLDVVSFLTHGRFSLDLTRYIQIDIDDVFVGAKGMHMRASDVQALEESQRRLADLIPGFHYNVGFSGKFFLKASAEENEDARHKFWWFPHFWSHGQAHNYYEKHGDRLVQEMERNKAFAQKHDIPVNLSYAVSPHHSGVYPVHEELYSAWKSVWNIQVSSTEEYPHLYPAHRRRGFVHRGIHVLPRQTCGLFTHTIYLDKYPGGPGRLQASIRGGVLFQTIVLNKFNIFMTHQSNYAHDRLAPYTMEAVIKFLLCWTNLSFQVLPPVELAAEYFRLHPPEKAPVWGLPCLDKRHRSIWAANKNCINLPNFIVIGPQKTGTTALYTFLKLHPGIKASYASKTTFEEVQFFNGKNYFKGLDWYMARFPNTSSPSNYMLFEKSATYFDSDEAPARVFALLPKIKIICILMDPVKRAYSWYQHMRHHDNKWAVDYTFYEVISAGPMAPHGLRELRNRCLNPGIYSQHIERWLTYFKPEQLLIVNGNELKKNPVEVMDQVQSFLKVEPYLDYSRRLRFNPQKGFWCQVTASNRIKCLGAGKGRSYPEMTSEAEKFLREYYRKYNVALNKLLDKLRRPVPQWLMEELGMTL